MPASKIFTISSGTTPDEQNLVRELEAFIVSGVGAWTLLDIAVDTGIENNRVYFSDGSQPGFYDRFYGRVQAVSDSLRFTAMAFYDVPSQTEYNPITNANTRVNTGTSSINYWFIGNEDFVHVVVSGTAGQLHGGFGLWETYYLPFHDRRPFLSFGQLSEGQTFESTIRVRSYGPGAWETPQTTVLSGTVRDYESRHNTLLTRGTVQPRTNEPRFFEPVFYTDADRGLYEVRGEIPGLFIVGGAPYTHGNIVTVTGTFGQQGSYFIHKNTDDISWAIGPIFTTYSG
jgi:hypothetical protein